MNSNRTEIATVGQRLLWALDRLRGNSGALNCPAVCYIDGPLDFSKLHEALEKLISTHTALRTTLKPGRSIQQISHPPRMPEINHLDFSNNTKKADIELLLKRELSSRIDPTISPIRISLITLNKLSYLLIINIHHIATDLISSAILIEDLTAELGAQKKSHNHHIQPWDHMDFSRWQLQQIESGNLTKQQRYWYERLAGMKPIANPLSPKRFDREGSTGLIEAAIGKTTRNQLNSIAESHQSSTFAILLAVLFSMAFRKTGDRDLAVASLFSNRTQPELQRTVGFFVNMLLLRVKVNQSPNFINFITQSQKAIIGALNNVDLPFQALSPPPRIKVRDNARVDDVVFHVSPDHIDSIHTTNSLKIRTIIPKVVGRFDLELAVRPCSQGYIVRLSYNEHRLSTENAIQLLNDYVETANLVAQLPERPIDHLGFK